MKTNSSSIIIGIAIITVAVVLLVTYLGVALWFFYNSRAVLVDGKSMEPTYAGGEWVQVDPTYTLAYNDVVVLYLPEDGLRQSDLPKRELFSALRFAQSLPFVGDKVKHKDYTGYSMLIKRIVGFPGDTIELKKVNANDEIRVVLVRNGTPAEDVVSMYYKYEANNYGKDNLVDTFGPMTLQEGQYFVLGDNRDNSSDSRSFGAIYDEWIYGVVRS